MTKVISKVVYRPFCRANIDLSISTRLSKIAAATCTLDRRLSGLRIRDSSVLPRAGYILPAADNINTVNRLRKTYNKKRKLFLSSMRDQNYRLVFCHAETANHRRLTSSALCADASFRHACL